MNSSQNKLCILSKKQTLIRTVSYSLPGSQDILKTTLSNVVQLQSVLLLAFAAHFTDERRPRRSQHARMALSSTHLFVSKFLTLQSIFYKLHYSWEWFHVKLYNKQKDQLPNIS